MLAHRNLRYVKAILLVLGWTATAVLGISAVVAGSARAAARYVACEVFIGGLSVTSSVLYSGSRPQPALACRHEGCSDVVLADHMEWAVELGQEIEAARRPIPRPARSRDEWSVASNDERAGG